MHGKGLIKHIVDGEVVLSYSEPQLDDRDAHARELMTGGMKLIEGGTHLAAVREPPDRVPRRWSC